VSIQTQQELKKHISALLLRKRELEMESRDRQIEADVIAAEILHLEDMLARLDTDSSVPGFFEVFEALPLPVIVTGLECAGFTCNSAARTLLGCSAEPETLPAWLQEEVSFFLTGQSCERSSEKKKVQCGAGTVDLQLELRRATFSGSPGVIITLHDISRYTNVEQALRLSEERYRTLVENQSDLVVKIDCNGIIQFSSPSFSRVIGIPEADLIACPLLPLIAGEHQARLMKKMHDFSCQDQACYEELDLQVGEDVRRYGWSVKEVTEGDGVLAGFICIGRDITEQKQAEENIQQLAYYDNLTGLPNRMLLQDRLLQVLSQTRRDERKAAVLFLDLDRFKTVNDTLGHAIGDELLKQVAQRLKVNIRDADTVARQGGDEFVIVLNSIESGRQAAQVASKVISALAHPFQVQGQSIFTGTSVGIALFPDDGLDAGTLLKHADMAMYLAKESGRGKFKFFSQELNDRMRERAQMEAALRQAITENQLFLQYQPQFNVKERRLTGLEAFVRWNHPEHGVLLPGRFIPLAEETGLIVPLGEWVLKTACSQAAGWQTAGKPPVMVSVNLSTRQFQHPDLLELVARSLITAGLPPHCLDLDIKEQTLLDTTDALTGTLQELKWQGVQLTIDDFGTGFSSLSYLRRIPVNRLKIDRSFIQNLHTNREDTDVAEAIISVGQRLKLQVVAEGVEHAEQLQFLHDRGCEEMQGNYFSCPLAPLELKQRGWFSARA